MLHINKKKLFLRHLKALNEKKNGRKITISIATVE